MAERVLNIINVKGLHARASARFVEVVEEYDASAGDSIMGLLMFGAACGSAISVTTSGPQADALADALEALVADKFGEEA